MNNIKTPVFSITSSRWTKYEKSRLLLLSHFAKEELAFQTQLLRLILWLARVSRRLYRWQRKSTQSSKNQNQTGSEIMDLQFGGGRYDKDEFSAHASQPRVQASLGWIQSWTNFRSRHPSDHVLKSESSTCIYPYLLCPHGALPKRLNTTLRVKT
jgi:hypothetical protein